MPRKERMDSISKLINEQADFISRHQLPSGAIPWYDDGITDPWDHVECAIALDLTGRFDQAVKAYMWLKAKQNSDGSWYSSYVADKPKDLTRDTNQSTYVATGVWYHYLLTGDEGFLWDMWQTVEAAIEFALCLQQSTGEIHWACNGNNKTWPGAILAASTCIWQSIRSAIKIANKLGIHKPGWEAANDRLIRAMKERPELFDRFGEDSQGFAINWYYPVLTGVVRGKEAQRIILERWNDFVMDRWGCKCVVGTPWVTVAETSELIMTLYRMGETDRANMLLGWMLQLKDHDGGFETGIKLPEQMIWPEEKNTWTSAGVIMAVSARAKVEGVSIEGINVC
ncbi:MAG: hypothetical protein NTZ04_07600 [Chloroflexi bacterium]|nr:hypothetical protein [Chloroflexota bacterium]